MNDFLTMKELVERLTAGAANNSGCLLDDEADAMRDAVARTALGGDNE